MTKYIQVFIVLLFVSIHAFAQSSNEKMMFVIDSLPILNNPEEWNEILDNDIADTRVIRNKDSLQLLGLKEQDAVTYIFTKEYRKRPDSLRQFPSLRQMKMEQAVWNYNGIPYSGRYIDYYNSGRKQNNGNLLDGKPNGEVKIFYQNGNPGSVFNYQAGVITGLAVEYYKTGILFQKCHYEGGRHEGGWETYHPNGQLASYSKLKNGKLVASALAYNSSGVELKKKSISEKTLQKIYYLENSIYQSQRGGDNNAVLKLCEKINKIDSSYTNVYFFKAEALVIENRFEEAIELYDRLLKIEPLTRQALVNSAKARVKKYEFEMSQLQSKNEGVNGGAAKEIAPISADEKKKICTDLLMVDAAQTLYTYVDRNVKFIAEALLKYCNVDVRR